MTVTKEDIARVKAEGFLLNRETQLFSGRVVTSNGVFTAAQLVAVARCAELFGSGTVALTVRLTAEIVGIPFEKIEQAKAFMAEAGLSFGGTGAKVRPVVACKGTTCVYGNLDTQALAASLYERFYVGMRQVSLPHKFKIGVGGCPNSCIKPSLNDFGVEGRRAITYDAEKCRGCKVCAVEAACPSRAVRVDNGKAVLDWDKCLLCGVCLGKCPFGAVPKQAKPVCRVYVGGTWGKASRMGTPLAREVAPEDLADLVEKTVLWYRENGYVKERLGAAIDRVGFEAFEAGIAGDDLLKRREAILAAPLKTRP